MAEADKQRSRRLSPRQFDLGGNLIPLDMTLHRQVYRTIISGRPFDTNRLPVFQPLTWSRLQKHETSVISFIDQHVPVQLEPGAVSAWRPEKLVVMPPMFDWFINRMAESACHHAVEGADHRFDIITQKVSRCLLVIDRLIGHAPPIQ